MATVLETIPEFEGSAERARALLPNFSFEQMRAMFAASCANDAHRIIAVLDEQGNVCGYSAYSIKVDAGGNRYGHLFSRGVASSHRRRGIASCLLHDAELWFREEGATYIQAETHTTNAALRALLEKHGFMATGPLDGHWPYYVLRKNL